MGGEVSSTHQRRQELNFPLVLASAPSPTSHHHGHFLEKPKVPTGAGGQGAPEGMDGARVPASRGAPS